MQRRQQIKSKAPAIFRQSNKGQEAEAAKRSIEQARFFHLSHRALLTTKNSLGPSGLKFSKIARPCLSLASSQIPLLHFRVLWAKQRLQLPGPELYRRMCLTISRTQPWLFVACLLWLSRCCCRGGIFSAQGIVCPQTFKVAFGERVVLVQKVLSKPASKPAAKKPAMHSFTLSSRSFVLDAKRHMSSA